VGLGAHLQSFPRKEEKAMPITHDQFMQFVREYSLKSYEIFDDREEAYSTEGDRLSQFFDVATDMDISPMTALLDMARKHWSMAVNLAKKGSTDLRLWNACCMDLHNYSLLLAAVVQDERIQGTPGPLVMKLIGRPVPSESPPMDEEDPEDGSS